MTLKLRAGQRQTSRLGLTPAMRQSLELLRLGAADLDAVVEREAAENPFLLRLPPDGDPQVGNIENFAAPEPGLTERLLRQLRLQSLAHDVMAAAVFLAGELREDGYLDTPLEEVAETLGIDLPTAEAALAALQSCEPPGIGARDLAECLRLQLADAGLEPALAASVVALLDQFAAPGREALAGRLGLSEPEMRRIAALVPTLRARPVEPESQAMQIVVPDLHVTRDASGRLEVSLHAAAVPRISLDEGALGSMRSGEIDALRASARSLCRAIRYRGMTLLRIGRLLIETQAPFFLAGPQSLVPMTRAAAAERLGLHPSTFGRAISAKAILFEGRHIPLSTFFGSSLGSGGGAVSSRAVQFRIRAMVEREDRASPLADAEIVAHLRREGVDISRRTVAKYRQWMRIPSSYARRRARPG